MIRFLVFGWRYCTKLWEVKSTETLYPVQIQLVYYQIKMFSSTMTTRSVQEYLNASAFHRINHITKVSIPLWISTKRTISWSCPSNMGKVVCYTCGTFDFTLSHHFKFHDFFFSISGASIWLNCKECDCENFKVPTEWLWPWAPI